jgi:hypothetical protein
VVVRAGDENIREAGQMLADALDLRMEEADEIDRDECDLVLAVLQNESTDLEWIVDAGGLAIVAETGHVYGLAFHARRDVRLGEADLQFLVSRGGARDIPRTKQHKSEAERDENDKPARHERLLSTRFTADDRGVSALRRRHDQAVSVQDRHESLPEMFRRGVGPIGRRLS